MRRSRPSASPSPARRTLGHELPAMCLILLAWRVHPRFPCVLAANRDEFHDRASAAAEWWPGEAGILAGRDLHAGGTWLGVTRRGHFAALTNFRDGGARRSRRAEPRYAGERAARVRGAASPRRYATFRTSARGTTRSTYCSATGSAWASTKVPSARGASWVPEFSVCPITCSTPPGPRCATRRPP